MKSFNMDAITQEFLNAFTCATPEEWQDNILSKDPSAILTHIAVPKRVIFALEKLRKENTLGLPKDSLFNNLLIVNVSNYVLVGLLTIMQQVIEEMNNEKKIN